MHGKAAVAVVDLDRYDIMPKAPAETTLAGFMERSIKYRGLADDVDFEPEAASTFRDKRTEIFDEDLPAENKT